MLDVLAGNIQLGGIRLGIYSLKRNLGYNLGEKTEHRISANLSNKLWRMVAMHLAPVCNYLRWWDQTYLYDSNAAYLRSDSHVDRTIQSGSYGSLQTIILWKIMTINVGLVCYVTRFKCASSTVYTLRSHIIKYVPIYHTNMQCHSGVTWVRPYSMPVVRRDPGDGIDWVVIHIWFTPYCVYDILYYVSNNYFIANAIVYTNIPITFCKPHLNIRYCNLYSFQCGDGYAVSYLAEPHMGTSIK